MSAFIAPDVWRAFWIVSGIPVEPLVRRVECRTKQDLPAKALELRRISSFSSVGICRRTSIPDMAPAVTRERANTS
jgi:hypothetical protein